MPITYRLLACLVVAVLLCGSGYGLGVKLERGVWLRLELDRKNAIAEVARIAASAETRRSAAQQQARDRVKTRVKVIEREYGKLPAGCDFGDDEFRLLNAERDALMGTGPSTLPGAVSGDAAVVEVGQADGT
ncbi:MAG TPA: hypothetical protein PLI17_10195 [Denitromonas sp.]|nr:hypothetical protein [Denitromonas sp.]